MHPECEREQLLILWSLLDAGLSIRLRLTMGCILGPSLPRGNQRVVRRMLASVPRTLATGLEFCRMRQFRHRR